MQLYDLTWVGHHYGIITAGLISPIALHDRPAFPGPDRRSDVVRACAAPAMEGRLRVFPLYVGFTVICGDYGACICLSLHYAGRSLDAGGIRFWTD
jgi:hypothetical protein